MSALPAAANARPSAGGPIGLAALAFLIMASYAVARPATESMFLGAFGSSALPSAWIAVAVSALIVAVVFGHRAARVELLGLVSACAAISTGLLLALLALRSVAEGPAIFLLYVWKDLYVVVLVEGFWSVANNRFAIRSARGTYGFFCAAGALGGMAGNLSVGALAERFGTARVILLCAPLLLAAAAGSLWLRARVLGPVEPAPKDRASLKGGLRALVSSRDLQLLCLTIGVVQVAVTLLDLQYNGWLETSYPELDRRTEVIGKVYAAIDFGSLALQLTSGPILKALGIPMTLIALPVLVGSALFVLLLVPSFLAAAAAKVISKSLDYSLFRIGKEVLYIPLGHQEKTSGKAVVDVFTYRAAKGGASFLLLLLSGLKGRPLTALTLSLCAVWLVAIGGSVRRFRRRVSRASELS